MKYRLILVCFTVVVGLSSLTLKAVASRGDAATPTLKLVGASGYQLAIQGSHWPTSRRVTFSLTQGTMVVGLELRTGSAGGFLIGIKHIYLCNGESFLARDFKGGRATLPGPPLECPARTNPPRPVISVLRGRVLNVTVTRVDVSGSGTPVVIRLAGAVILREAGATRPAWIPATSARFFQQIDEGRTACEPKSQAAACVARAHGACPANGLPGRVLLGVGRHEDWADFYNSHPRLLSRM